jgi:pimeloyl-ACP methyl ester carboxylesterase
MPKSKPIDTIHDLFATTRRPPEIDAGADYSNRFQGNVYEQLAALEYIYLDELTAEKVDDSYAMSMREPISLADFFEGLTQLATMGVVEITDIVEAIHREILLRPLGRFNEGNLDKWQGGITGRIYGTIRSVMALVGNNLASGLRLYNNVRNPKEVRRLPRSLRRLVNILNGVMGDHLVNHDNPLAVPMVLYASNGYPQREPLSGRIVVLCHGLGLSHLSWQASKIGNLGEQIIESMPNTTVLYLNYNTGRRISTNGRDLSKTLQDLVDNNPDITQIDLIGHSMGGLVARSSLFYGKEQGFNWEKQVGNLITLGSPHQGASLERIGNFVQERIAQLPFAGSLAKLGDLRSAGVIDLRHGSIRDADWKSLEGRSVLPADFRHPARLPLHVRTYLVAAVLVEPRYDSKTASFLGDGLVAVESALGEHTEEHTLAVPEGRKAVFYGVNHMNLMYSRRVTKQVVAWLLDNGQSEGSDEDDVWGTRINSYPNDLSLLV